MGIEEQELRRAFLGWLREVMLPRLGIASNEIPETLEEIPPMLAERIDSWNEKLLQQSLMHLRMSFVQAVEKPPETEPATQPAETASQPQAEENPTPAADSAPEESRKRFTKKF